MLTLFTTPKPFKGHDGLIQMNALRSWAGLAPKVEILVLGEEPGAREACEATGARHGGEVSRSPFGTPLVSDIFEKAQALARTDLVCYVNADILLFGDFMEAVRIASRLPGPFLLAGQRWDLDVRESLDFGGPEVETLKFRARTEGVLHPPCAIDYFVFPRGFLDRLPSFSIGRMRWDNWLIRESIRRGGVLVDATPSVVAIHQNHGYAHVPDMKVDEAGRILAKGEENRLNIELAGNVDFRLSDSTHVLRNGAVEPVFRLRRKNVHIHFPGGSPARRLAGGLVILMDRLLPGSGPGFDGVN
jgi:hypothetical protein